MNNTQRIAFFLFLALATIGSNGLQAQTKVALVDVGLVFKNHPQFSSQLAQLKSQAEQFKAESQQLQQQLMQKAEGLAMFEKDSDQYRDEEAKLAQESATLEVQQRGKMRKLLQQEAELHFDTYVEISNYISQYCQENKIELVLRFNSEEMDSAKPATIMQQVNGGVVFYTRSADVTNDIIQRIAQRQASNPGVSNR